MKPTFLIYTVLLCGFLFGCSHVTTVTIPCCSSQEYAKKLPDLNEFWKVQGFRLVNPSSDIGKLLYADTDGAIVVAVWEKWYPSLIFKASGGMWATVNARNNSYEIVLVPVSSSRDVETQVMAGRLKMFLDKEFPEYHVSVKCRSFVDFR